MPDEKVAWAATTGAINAGAVFFDSVAADCTRVRLTLDFERLEGVVERIGDVLDVVQRQAVADLDQFKEFIEGQSSAAGGWRGKSEDGGVMSQETEGQAIRKTEDVPGDVVAVGPAGDTESTLTTNPEPAPSSAPEADYSAVGHSGDPVAVGPEALGATTGTDEAWAPGGSGPGEDIGVRDTGGEGVVARNYADEDITTEDVVARDFANRHPVKVSWSGTSQIGTSPSATSHTAG